MKNLFHNRRVLITSIIAVVLLALIGSFFIFRNQGQEVAAADWFDEAWYFRKAMEIDYTKIDEQLSNFPIAVQFNSDTNIYSNTNADGSDLRFTDINGNPLKYEIEKWNESGTSTVWVKVPTVYTNASTTFYIYYGNPSAEDAQTPHDVWDDYVMVQHMNNTATGTNDFVDSTSYNNDGTGYGGVSLVATTTGKTDGAFEFDGDNDYVTMPDDPSLGGMTQLTVSAWLFFEQLPSTVGNDGGILTKRHSGSPYRNYYFNIVDSGCGGNDRMYLNITWHSGGQSSFCGGTDLATSTWYHVAFAWDGSNIHFYLNGDNDDNGGTSFTSNYIYDTDGLQFINYLSHTDGMIDDVRIATVGRSAAWMKAEYNNGTGALVTQQVEEQGPGPVAYWKFDEGYGQTAYDSSPNNYDGTITEAEWRDNSECIKGKCLYFDGVGDIINSNLLDFSDTDRISVSVWIKPNDIASLQNIIELGDSNGHALWLNNSGGVYAGSTFLSSGWTTVTSNNSVLDPNKWSHVVYTYDGNNQNLYLDGILIKTNNISEEFSNSVSGDTEISADGGYFTGFIDEVKIYNYARTADQIRQDYNKGFSVYFGADADQGLTEGLVGYWPMDESAGNTCSGGEDSCDSSGNGNHGTWNGTAAATSTAKYGRAIELDGDSDAILLTSEYDNSDLALALWFRADDFASIRALAGHNSYSNPLIQIADSTTIRIRTSEGTLREFTVPAMSPETWYHLVVLRENGVFRLYLNGVESSTGDIADSGSYQINIIGRYQSAGWFKGEIDEVRVYNRALSSDEVRHLYEWAPGPVSHWKFDEKSGTTAYDTAASTTYTGGNHGILGEDGVGTDLPTWTDGKYGSALDYDGSDDTFKVDLASDDFMTMTVEIWFKADPEELADNGDGEMFAWGPNGLGSGSQYLAINQANSTLRFYSDCANRGTAPIEADKWYHAAVTRDGSEHWVYYLNGQVTGTYDDPGVSCRQTNGDVVWLGQAMLGYFDGQIDDVRIYNYARSQRQILEDMNAGRKNNPIAYWNFDEGQGDTAYDSGIIKQITGSGNDGTLTNMATTSTSTAWTLGKSGGTLKFDGTDDVVTITNVSALDFNENLKNSVSFSAWIKPNSDGENSVGQVFWKGDGTYLRLGNESNGVMDLGASVDLNVTDAQATATASIRANQWNHVVVTWEDDADDELTIYVNGEKKVTSTNGSGAAYLVPDTNNLLIGGTTKANFNGLIDEFKVYNYPITLDEIRQNYQQGKQITLSKTHEEDTYEGLIGWWKMDEADSVWEVAGQIIDYSGNGNHVSSTGVVGTSTAKFGRAGYFDGTGDGVTNTDANNLLSQHGTISYWLNITTKDAENDVFEISEQLFQDYLAIRINGNNLMSLRIEDDNDDKVVVQYDLDNLGSFENQWLHIVWTQDGNGVRLFINGQEKTNFYNSTNSGDWWTGHLLSTINLRLGYSAWEELNGMLDDFKIYNYALSSDEIMREYADIKPPVGHWKFDEMTGTNVADSSGNGYAAGLGGSGGTSDNYPTWNIEGKYGSTLKYDGTNDWVQTNTDIDFGTSDLSVSLWFWPDDPSRDECFIGHRTVSNYFIAKVDTTTIRLRTGENVARNFTVPTITAKTWHQVTVTREGGVFRVFVDGVESSTGGITDEGGYIINSFGRYQTGSWFKGFIDDVKFYDYALTQRQIVQEYNGGGPVGYWKFDKGEGGTAYDYSGNGYNGTIYPGTGGSNTATSSMWSNGATGKFNGSLDFDGTDDFISIPDTSSLRFDAASSDFSVFAWVKKAGNGVTDGIISKLDGADDGWELIFTSSDTVRCSVDAIDITSSKTITDTNWHQIGCTIDRDGNGQVYIDGELSGSTATISSEAMATTATVEIGLEQSNYFDGQIDEIKVYNYVLTPEDIKKEYNGGFSTFFR